VAAAAEVLWKPNPGPQTRALASPVFELGYGGGAGGGKTDWLLVVPLRWIALEQFRGIIFRRTFTELEQQVIPRAWELYHPLGGNYNESKHRWIFYDAKGNPRGRVQLAHLQHEKDILEYRGAPYQYGGFDELPTFTRFQYTYFISRMRSAHGIPIRLRSSMNPEPGWVRDRFAPWVRTAKEYSGPRVKDGAVLYFLNEHGQERYVPQGTPKSFSRQFIASALEDNPHLHEKDPDYVHRLSLLDPVQYARLRENDWESEYAAGLMFQRGWFELVDAAPAHAQRARYWDRAATEVRFKGQASLQPQAINDPDWTAGPMCSRDRKTGRFYVEDVVRFRGKPGDVEQTILKTAEADEQKYGRHGFTILLEQEPGASGEAEVANYLKLLARWHVVAIRATGDKIRRAGPASAQSQARNVSVLRGEWNGAFFSELEAFPKGKHDDQVDGFSGAYNWLSSVPLETSGSSRGERKATNSGGF
jgi:predicted phage terminase large subunit-like protein